MIIAIGGLTGSGKNAVGERVAKRLGLRLISFTFKDLARENGIPLMEFQKLASRDGGKIDRDFDARIAKEAKRGKCVITTWLGAWTVKNCDLRVWLDAKEETRAKRLVGRDKMDYREALAHVRARDRNNWKRYKKYYGIDIHDLGPFDLRIKTDEMNPAQIAEIIAAAARVKAR